MAERWRVFYSLDSGEQDRISRAAIGFLDNYLVVSEVPPGGGEVEPQLAFSITADDRHALVRVAEDMYGKVRDRAGLDPARGRLLAVVPLEEAPWERALQKAVSHTDDDEAAVIFAQVACETRATDALRTLIERQGVSADVANAFIGSTSLRDQRSRRLLNRLAGVEIEGEDWWDEYLRHVRRRNLVIHDGAAVTRDEAERSLDAARSFCARIGNLIDETP